jgi:hypothetical protein
MKLLSSILPSSKEIVCYSETSVNICLNTRCHIPEDNNLHSYCSESLKYQMHDLIFSWNKRSIYGTGQCNGNALVLHSRGVRFESRLGCWVFWHYVFLWLFSVPPCKCGDTYSTIASLQILSNWTPYHPTLSIIMALLYNELSTYLSICLFFNLWLYRPFVGPWSLFQFLNPAYSR